jgi:hypothetical protein
MWVKINKAADECQSVFFFVTECGVHKTPQDVGRGWRGRRGTALTFFTSGFK